MPEQTYTLDEARREIKRQDCAANGHSWDVFLEYGGVPVEIVCDCGASYKVVPREKPSYRD